MLPGTIGSLFAARALPWGRVLLVRTRRGGLQCPAWKNRNISFTNGRDGFSRLL